MENYIGDLSNLDKLCRTCLLQKESEDLRSLFEDTLDEMLNGLASIKVCFCFSNLE